MAFIFERCETDIDTNIQRITYMPKWYDGLSRMEYVTAACNLMRRAGIFTDEVRPWAPTDCLFYTYAPSSISDYTEGVFVFEIKRAGMNVPICRFKAEFGNTNKARMDYISCEMFTEFLETSNLTPDMAFASMQRRAKELL